MALYDNIPDELKQLKQWVVWERKERNGKITKPPVHPLTGKLVSISDPNDWTDFGTAVSNAHRFVGIGFVFTPDDPYTGVDCDKTTDPALWAVQSKIYQSLDSYTERSPSGDGVHIIVRASLPGAGRRKYSVECYDRARYFTFTGDIVGPRTTIESRQEVISQLYSELGGGIEADGADSGEQLSSDDDILRRARNAANGSRFSALFAGEWTTTTNGKTGQAFSSQSEADFALINMLGLYTQNHDQIARIFRASGLGQRDKAERDAYLAPMIAKAMVPMAAQTIPQGLKDGVARGIAGMAAKAFSEPRIEVKAPLIADVADVEIIPATDVDSVPIKWLWPGWLAKGKFHLLGGAPMAGKTTIMLELVACLSRGGPWPDGTRTAPGNALIWTGEDDLGDTIKPRLEATGADLSRIAFVTARRDVATGKMLPFNPATDLPALQAQVQRMGGSVDLIGIDPVVSVVGGRVNSHNNAETRVALQPVVDFAQALDCAVVGITHFTKGTHGRDPNERMTGSLAFVALARVAMVALINKRADEEGEHPRLFLRTKSNAGPCGDGFGYDIVQTELHGRRDIVTSKINWTGSVDGDAKDIMDEAERDEDNDSKKSKEDTARDWLHNELLPMKQRAVDVIKRAKEAGISERTLRRARAGMVIITKDDGHSYWELDKAFYTAKPKVRR